MQKHAISITERKASILVSQVMTHVSFLNNYYMLTLI